eukprot:1997261-Rhodomonas_salina.1
MAACPCLAPRASIALRSLPKKAVDCGVVCACCVAACARCVVPPFFGMAWIPDSDFLRSQIPFLWS